MVSCLLSLILYSKNKIFLIHEYSMNRIHSEEKSQKVYNKANRNGCLFFFMQKIYFLAKLKKIKLLMKLVI